jgi:hypothetical protein
MIKDKVTATGRVHIVLTGKDGKVKETRDIHNLVVDVGEAFIASRMAGTSAAVMSHIGIGSGTTAAAAGQTALVTAVGARVALTSTTVATNAVTYVAAFAAGASTGAITEAGLFNALTAGTMLCRTVFAVVNKGVDDTLSIQWIVTING